MTISKRWAWIAVCALLILQAAQVAFIVHRESLTFDEDDHIFAGYMMLKTADYGLNPEHPPLAKLLAALPLLGRNLWTPPLQNREFKMEAYLDGRDFLARNDGSSQHLVFRMRLCVGLLALALSVVVFLAAQEWFGTGVGLLALLLVVFDPNLLANSALVTTDIGVSLFFLLGIYTFYRYVKKPSLPRLVLCTVTAALTVIVKHSGILILPTLVLLTLADIFAAPRQLPSDIPSQPLADALLAYGTATGLQVFYDGALEVGHRSTTVKGRFTSMTGLQTLLQGTGYVPQATVDSDTITIVMTPQASTLSALPSAAQLRRYEP